MPRQPKMSDSTWSQPAFYWVVGFSGIVVLLLVIIWSIRRHRDPKLQIECDIPIEELIPSLAGLSLSAPISGNAVKVHRNGA
jgi:cardiolipin synthase